MPTTELARLRHAARPDSLPSLRRLDDALTRTGRLVRGRPVREWTALLAKVFYSAPSHRLGSADGSALTEWRLEPNWLPETTDRPAEAIDALVEAGLAAVPALVEALTAHPPRPDRGRMRVVAGCVDALARIRPVPTCAVPAVLAALRTASPRAASALLFHLSGPLRPRATALAVAAVAERLHPGQEERVRIHAAQALSRLDGPLPTSARAAALAGLGDPLLLVRRYCVHALGRVPGPDTEAATALRAEGGREDVNLPDVIRALAQHDEQQALLMLRQAISDTTAEDQRRARCLHVAAELGHRARPLLPFLRPGEPIDEAAARAMRLDPTDSPAEPPSSRRRLLRHVADLAADDRPLAVRIALAAVREAAHLYDPKPDVRAAVAAVSRRLAKPLEPWPDHPGEPDLGHDDPWESWQRALVRRAAGHLSFLTGPQAAPTHAVAAVDHACRALAASLAPGLSVVCVETPRDEQEAVARIHRAIAAEVPKVLAT
ncbi:hypothetical protein ACWCXH_32055 [Kitasatospora sp. NPDC001660]